MLSCPKLCKSNLENSQALLNLFVENFQIVFGKNSVSFNIHNLLHLKESIEYVGDLSSCTAYPFENYLQILKKSVKKPTQVLEQIYRKLVEENCGVASYQSGFNATGTKYSFNDCVLTTKNPDNFCYVKNNMPVKILKFVQDNRGCIVCQKFKNIRKFYKEPCDSTLLGIFLVETSNSEETFLIDDIQCKAIAFPHKDGLLVMPVLHGCH